MRVLPDPVSNPELFESLLPRRAVAYVIDIALLGVMLVAISLIGLILGIFTLGLMWLAIPVAMVLGTLGYYAGTLGGPRRATVGMQAMDIVLTPTRGQPLDGWMAIVHAGVFWITTWISWPLSLLFALFTPRRQMVHDLITGTLMVRRSPMVRHWQAQSARTSQAY